MDSGDFHRPHQQSSLRQSHTAEHEERSNHESELSNVQVPKEPNSRDLFSAEESDHPEQSIREPEVPSRRHLSRNQTRAIAHSIDSGARVSQQSQPAAISKVVNLLMMQPTHQAKQQRIRSQKSVTSAHNSRLKKGLIQVSQVDENHLGPPPTRFSSAQGDDRMFGNEDLAAPSTKNVDFSLVKDILAVDDFSSDLQDEYDDGEKSVMRSRTYRRSDHKSDELKKSLTEGLNSDEPIHEVSIGSVLETT